MIRFSVLLTLILVLSGCTTSSNPGGVIDCDPETVSGMRALQCQTAWERRQAGREHHLRRMQALQSATEQAQSELLMRREAAFVELSVAQAELTRISSNLTRLASLNERALNQSSAIDEIARELVALDRTYTEIAESQMVLAQAGLCPEGQMTNRAIAQRTALREGVNSAGSAVGFQAARQVVNRLPGKLRFLRPFLRGVIDVADHYSTANSVITVGDSVVTGYREGWENCRAFG